MSHLFWLDREHLKRIQHLFPKPRGVARIVLVAKSRVIKYVGVTFRDFATLPFDEGRCAEKLGARGRTLRSAANLSRKAGPIQIGRRAEFLRSVVETVYECP